MNRQQRRQQARPIKIPTYNLNNLQIREAIQEEINLTRKETLNYAITRCMAAFLVSLHDEYDFGTKRLTKLLERVNETFACIEAGTVSLDDLVTLCDSFGIVLEGGTKPYEGL